MTLRYLASALALGAALTATHASAETVVKLLRAETNAVEKDVYAQAEADFEAANPDVDVQIEYLANEAYKQKLPTLLQSDARPDIFYSWGGETCCVEQADGRVPPAHRDRRWCPRR